MPSTSSTVTYLRSLAAVRERSNEVFRLIVDGKADHWDWHEDKLATVVDFCAGLLSVGTAGIQLQLVRPRVVADSSATLVPTLTRFPVSRWLPGGFLSAFC